jgi:hypothetical protein
MWIEHIITSLFIKIILCYTPHNKMILINVNIFIRTENTLVFLMYISTLWNKHSAEYMHIRQAEEEKEKKTQKNKNKVN